MCLKYILFSNFMSIGKVECIDKIRIKCIAKKRKNKKLIAIYKVDKGQNCKHIKKIIFKIIILKKIIIFNIIV